MTFWGVLSVITLIISIIFFIKTNAGKLFFISMNLINLLLFSFVLIIKKKLFELFQYINIDFKRISQEAQKPIAISENKFVMVFRYVLITIVSGFGVFIVFLSIADIGFYSYLIREDGIVENSSAILWLLATLVLLSDSARRIIKKDIKFDFCLIPYIILILFFIVCAGEEISWGQRILHIDTPGFLTTINVQNETNLHNVGSISVFSNIFFILNIIFFLLLPVLKKKYIQLANYLDYYSFPVPDRTVVSVFLITLIIWVILGVRFGTLGFHPYSFYIENYYNQMDDEIFELLAAYSFFAFSAMHIFEKRKINVQI